MRSVPFCAAGGQWRGMDLPWVAAGGQWRRVQQAWAATGSVWSPIWDLLELPYEFQNSTYVSGRWGEFGGVLWGNSTYYTEYHVPTVKRVVGVVINLYLSGKQGGWSHTGGLYAAGQNKPGDNSGYWLSQAYAGWQRSPVLPCNFAAGEPIRIWAYGGGSKKGEGKNLTRCQLVDVIYG